MSSPGGAEPRRARSPIGRVLRITGLGAVIGLAGLFALYPAVGIGRLAGATSDRARLDIATIGGALKLYAAKFGHFPDASTGVQALVDVQILERMPVDPWNRPYLYGLGPDGPILASYGADGVPGGTGEDADIVSVNPKVLSSR